jgi:hypothetical protein
MKGSGGNRKSLDEKIFEFAEMETYDRSRGGSLQHHELSAVQLSDYLSESLLKPSILSLKTPDPCDLFQDPLQTSPSYFSEASNHEIEPSKLDTILQNLSSNSITSESLLLNTDLDFLETISSKTSMSLSLTYSNTVSSIFPTFLSQNILLKSLPVSPNGTGGFNSRSFETADPRYLIDRIDLGVDEMEELSEEDEKILKESLNQVNNQDENFSPPLIPETSFQVKDTKCTCDKCSIF